MSNAKSSSDAITWQDNVNVGVAFNASVWAPELQMFIAVGQAVSGVSSGVYTSVEGETWVERAAPVGAEDVEWRGIAWSPALGKAVAFGTVPFASDIATMESTDGVTWQLTTDGSLLGGYIRAIVWASGLNLFVVSSSDGAYTSANGIAWTFNDYPGTLHAGKGIAYSPSLNRLVIAVDSTDFESEWLYSDDGETWVEVPFFGVAGLGVAWSPELGVFVGVGKFIGQSAQCAVSADGANWTLGADQTAINGVKSMQTVIWSAALGLCVAIPPNGSGVWTSPDGRNWTVRSIGSVITTFSVLATSG